jgi:ABC-type glutathione transport system ATPase component
MQVRLAFSVANQVDADILLIDEVLAVGDAAFQQKCNDVFHRLHAEGKTIVLVTHDMTALRRFCDRAMLLENGKMVHVGESEEVADQYLEINFGREPAAAGDDGHRRGDGDARVMEVWTEDAEGTRQLAIPQGQRMTLRVLVHFMVDVDDPQASVYVVNEDQKTVLVASSWVQHESSGRFSAGEQVLFSFTFENVLAPGRYSPIVSIAHRGTGLDVIDRYERGFSFLVTATAPQGGMIDLPTEVEIERVESSVEQELNA